MNFLVLVAAVMILTADSNHSGRSSDSRVSTAIEYRTVDRSGDELIVSFNSGDPYFGRYYGRDYFYYDDRRYYRYYPAYRYYPVRYYPVRRTIFVREPVLIVENRYYDRGDDWKSVREHEKGISKAIKEEGKWRKEVSKDWGRASNDGFKSSSQQRGKGNGKGGGKSKGKGNGKN